MDTYEKKYKEALENAGEIIRNKDASSVWKDWLRNIFPELKESEDEKTRKELIAFLEELSKLGKNTNFDRWKTSDCANWISWLEKQGEKKISYTTTVETGDGGINTLVTGDIEIPFGAKDSELQEVSYHIPEGFYAEIEGDKVIIKQGEKKSLTIDIKSMVDSYEQRLIKNGGVNNSPLVNMCVAAFQHGVENTLDELHLKQILANSCKTCKDEQKPFDYENSYCQENCKGFQETGRCFADWECKAKKEAEQKPAWSEEDERILDALITSLNNEVFAGRLETLKSIGVSLVIDWLKSLKERIKQ